MECISSPAGSSVWIEDGQGFLSFFFFLVFPKNKIIKSQVSQHQKVLEGNVSSSEWFGGKKKKAHPKDQNISFQHFESEMF